jgi:hypothetical protein
VHAATTAAPAEVVVSLECDLLLDEGDAAAEVLQRALGPQSSFHEEHGFYADAVPPGIPVLARGWRDRLQRLDAGGVVGLCLELHDLSIAKLAAGRLKDYELVAALLARGLVTVGVLRDRIATFEEVRMRAILLARMQIAMESVGVTP